MGANLEFRIRGSEPIFCSALQSVTFRVCIETFWVFGLGKDAGVQMASILGLFDYDVPVDQCMALHCILAALQWS